MDKTVLIVDVESGSVGCALARITPGGALARQTGGPKLFAEARVALPIFSTLSSATLIREIEKTTREMLAHASLVAARLRGHRAVAQMGVVSSVLIFLSPPWTSLAQTPNGLQWEHESTLVSALHDAVEEGFGDTPISFHAFGTSAVHATNTQSPKQHDFLLCTVGGEVVELVLVGDGRISGHTTIPFGRHSVLRTLQQNAGISTSEAQSALRCLYLHAVAAS